MTGRDRADPPDRAPGAASSGGAFQPECLTIGLGNDCNQACSYCYAEPRTSEEAPGPSWAIFLDAIRAAAEHVAAWSRKHGRPLVFGFQGAGEPFLDFARLETADEVVRQVAGRHRLRTHSFITSNGTLAPERYIWAATRFDRICLSVDGPPSVHDAARVYKVEGGCSSLRVRETAALLTRLGKRPVARVTVTRENEASIDEIVDYLFGALGLREVQMEPVYLKKHMEPDPERFVDGLLRGRRIARHKNAKLRYSGYRPTETHGPYCNTEKRVLFLTRRATASACLLRERAGAESQLTLGAYRPDTARFELDQEKVARVEAAVRTLAPACVACPIRQHCTRGCPDVCYLERGGSGLLVTESLRCRINRLLAAKARSPGTRGWDGT